MPQTTHQSLKGLLLQGLMLGSVALLAMNMLAPSTHAGSSDTVKVCHHPPGNPSNIRIIEIPRSALNDHLAHHDTVFQPFYQDADGDGFGTPMVTIEACTDPD